MPASTSAEAAELLRKAARCYAQADWPDDACRLFLRLHDDQSAGPYLEQLGRHSQAAGCYERLGNWSGAARCHLRTGAYDRAADALYRAGDRIRAAWIWAHHANRHTHAETVLDEVASEPDPDNVSIDLVRSRCHAAAGRQREGARLLQTLLGTLVEDVRLARHFDWLLEVAEALARPDLLALAYASAHRAGLPDAQKRWRDWAERTLGDIAGVPLPTQERSEETTAENQPEGESSDG